MAARGITGQSIASQVHGVALFGGFDDKIVRLDLLTGRVTSIESVGRTVLYPWDQSHFVCIEDALGRPSKTRLTLRPYGEPSEVASADGEWASTRVLIPGHYPTLFEVEGGKLHERTDQTNAASETVLGFVPGLYTDAVPVLVDGAWTAADGSIVSGVAVGRDTGVFFANTDGLVVLRSGSIVSTVAMGEPWRPAVIEHDPVGRRVAVASWNRWGSLGGPSSDIYVFDEDGSSLGRGRDKGLVERMALDANGATVMDINNKTAFVELEPAVE